MNVLLLFFLLSMVNAYYNGNILEATSNNIEEVLAKRPLLIEFYAPWCGHCQRFEQAYERVAESLGEEGFTVARVEITR